MARRPRSARNDRAALRREQRRQRQAARSVLPVDPAGVAIDTPADVPARGGAQRLGDAGRSAREVGRSATSGDRPYLAGFLVLLVLGLLTLFGPLQSFLDGRARVETLTTQAQALEAENERLGRLADDLEDPSTIELLARENQGLVRPGERSYVIVPPAEERPLIDTEPDAVVVDAEPWWRRAWVALFGSGDPEPQP